MSKLNYTQLRKQLSERREAYCVLLDQSTLPITPDRDVLLLAVADAIKETQSKLEAIVATTEIEEVLSQHHLGLISSFECMDWIARLRTQLLMADRKVRVTKSKEAA